MLMADRESFDQGSSIVEQQVRFTLVQLSQACSSSTVRLVALVEEGVLEPSGTAPGDWLFDGGSLRRARLALRLERDLELNEAGVALALELLDEISELRARLRRLQGSSS
jgi:chaperone modulatory protein CbpM